MLQGCPAGGVACFEEGDIEGDGVVDTEILDEGDVDAGCFGIALVELAALAERDGAGAPDDQKAGGEQEEATESG